MNASCTESLVELDHQRSQLHAHASAKQNNTLNVQQSRIVKIRKKGSSTDLLPIS
jgi:hypothetical protein